MAGPGFGCSKNALIALNVLYICVSIVLIGVAGYGIAASSITSFTSIIAIIATSVFLLILAVVGIVAAIKHHQVMLFFYMIILFILFIVQFSVACACLAIGDQQIRTLMDHGYLMASNETRTSLQTQWDCCGFDSYKDYFVNGTSSPEYNIFCSTLPCCAESHQAGRTCCAPNLDTEHCPCQSCFSKMDEIIKASLRLCGGIGLFFSFTEVVGIFIALRYRNQKNPQFDPSDFL